MDKALIELFNTLIQSSCSNKESAKDFIEKHSLYLRLHKEIEKIVNRKTYEDTPIHYALRMGIDSIILAALLDIVINITEESLNLSPKTEMRPKHNFLIYDIVNDTENPDGHALLHIASSRGDLQSIQLLLEEYNADINRHSKYIRKTPLHIALEHQQIAAAKYLLSRRECSAYAVDMKNRSALFFALSAKPVDLDLVNIILHKSKTETWAWNFDVLNYSDSLGKTIAHHLFRTGEPKLIKDVLSLKDTCGKNILENLKLDVKDNQGITPLDEAVIAGVPEALKLLL